jgi:hypothetical protein
MVARYAAKAAENWFEDYREGTLVNGAATQQPPGLISKHKTAYCQAVVGNGDRLVWCAEHVR